MSTLPAAEPFDGAQNRSELSSLTPAHGANGWRNLPPGDRIARALLYGFLIVMAVLVGFPLFQLIAQSLMHNNDILHYPPQLIAPEMTFENYTHLFASQDLMLPRWLLNSFFVSTSITIGVLVIASLAAYAFARLHFPGQRILFFFFLATVTLPSQVTLIPNFLLMRDLHFLDNYNGLIWPGLANVFAIFLLRQFFAEIPVELEEAAILDGASRWGVFIRIIVPLSSSALTALGILVFLNAWNDLFWPLIVTNSVEMRTLPVGLTVLNGNYGALDRGLVLAGATFATIPVLIVYIIFQRRIIKGITLTGMGGR
ncbi:MAG: carbohydrate ABC transporter permease [Aggregatilineales bacterium]